MANGNLKHLMLFFEQIVYKFTILLLYVYYTLNGIKYTPWGLGNMYCVVEEIIVQIWFQYNPVLVDFESNVVYRSFETVML